jgi:hypothetical protein
MPSTEQYVLFDAGVFTSVPSVFTYDAEDWESFKGDGLSVAGPAATLARLGRS